jgi:hypothetical protein
MEMLPVPVVATRATTLIVDYNSNVVVLKGRVVYLRVDNIGF